MFNRISDAGPLRVVTAGALFVSVAVCACSKSSPAKVQASTRSTSVAAVTEPASSASSAAPVSLPDPCSLLTKAEAEKLAGVRMQPGDDTQARDPATDVGSCTYDAVFTGPSGSVDIFDQVGMPHAMQVDRAIHHKFRAVPGIGDQTLEEPENESIFIRKGQVWVYLEASNSTPATLEASARLIASRLP